VIRLAVVFRMTNEKTNLPPRITGENVTKLQLSPEGRGSHVNGSPRIGFCGPVAESRGASGRETLATAGVEVSAEELTGFAVQFVTLAQMQNSTLTDRKIIGGIMHDKMGTLRVDIEVEDPARAGERRMVRSALVESSANGKVRAAHDQCTVAVRDEAIDVHQGRAENVHAASDEACVQKSLAGHRLSALTIGLNPALTDLRNPGGMPLEINGEGLVAIHFGDNRFFGGSNADGPNWYVPLTKATVSVDGKPIVRDGQLVDRR